MYDPQANRRAGTGCGVARQEVGPAALPLGGSLKVHLRSADEFGQSANRLSPAQAIDGILNRQHRRRVDGLALEQSLIELAVLGQAEQLGQGPGWQVAFQASHGAGPQTSTLCAPSAPRPFCHDNVTTSSLSQGRSMTKAAEVASQMINPLRSAEIHSPSGTRT